MWASWRPTVARSEFPSCARLEQIWNPETGQWDDWGQYEMIAEGTIWVVKKDSSANQPAIESLVKCADWTGNLEDVTSGIWQPTPCQVVVNREVYKEQERFKISFLNEYDRTPGGVGNVSPERAKQLQAKFGAQFRALAGNAARNAAIPAGKPPAPKPPLKNAKPVPAATQAADPNAALDEAAKDGCPF